MTHSKGPVTTGGASVAMAVMLAVFFLSGFAALIYQVAWQRMLTFFSGADLFSVTLVVGAFMAGLGLGNMAGGQIADRLSRQAAIWLFAAAEVSVACFALLSKWFYYDLLYVQFGQLVSSPLVTGCVLFVALLFPTFLMGMSLPLLTRGMTVRLLAAAGTIGALYAVNTLGAAAGAFGAAWFVIREFGLEGAIRVGAGLNLLCGAGACLVGVWQLRGESPEAESTPQALADESRDEALFPFGTWMAIYAMSGFIALSLEMVWFRLLGVIMKSNAFTFPMLLTHYLTGLALGSFIGIAISRRVRNPARVFFFCQGLGSVYAAVFVAFLVWSVGVVPIRYFDEVWWHLRRGDPLDLEFCLRAIAAFFDASIPFTPEMSSALGLFVLFFVVLPAGLIIPPTVLMGVSFPMLQKVIQTDMAYLGRRTGWIQTANIIGSTLGSFVGSWVMLRFLGTAWTLSLLVCLGGSFWLLGVYAQSRGKARPVARYGLVCAVIAVSVLILPSNASLWAWAHGAKVSQIYFDEDGTGVFVMKRLDAGDTTIAYVNGVDEGSLPYSAGNHPLLGLLPSLIHPNPERIAVIGLGSGNTAFSIGSRMETRDVQCVEIITVEYPVLFAYNEEEGYGGLDSLFNDERFTWTFADGRAFIARSTEKFDIIEADALRPIHAYSGNLYSVEYFTLLKEHLKPGGYAASYAPTARVVQTFATVFPYVHIVTDPNAVMTDDLLVIGSETPIEFDRATIRARLTTPHVQAYLAKADIDTGELLEKIENFRVRSVSPADKRSPISELNTDLFPRDEYLHAQVSRYPFSESAQEL